MDDLGQVISEHGENKHATGSTLLIGLLCIGLSVGMVILFNDEKDMSFNKVLFGLSAIFSFIGAIGCIWSVIKNHGGRVKLYENGISVEKGGKKHLAKWDEIAVVKESIEAMHVNGNHVYDRYSYNIEKRNGETFALSNMISNIDQVGRIIKDKTFERLYPQSVEKIDNGGSVSFDLLIMDKNGVSGIPWSQLSHLKVEDGNIEVKDKDDKVAINGSYAATPNAHLFVALLKKYIASAN